MTPVDVEVRNLLQRAAEEINHLRAVNRDLAPRARAYEALATVIGMLPRPGEGMVEDIAWRIDKFLIDNHSAESVADDERG